MNWNHRVMRKMDDTIGEPVYQIHEVFYFTEEDGKGGVVAGWTENGVAPFGETKKELKKELKRMLDSLDKPVLDYDTGQEIKKPAKKENGNG